jgi:hypothetical protein
MQPPCDITKLTIQYPNKVQDKENAVASSAGTITKGASTSIIDTKVLANSMYAINLTIPACALKAGVPLAPSSGGLSQAAVIGIAIGCSAAAFCYLVFCVTCCCAVRKRAKDYKAIPMDENQPTKEEKTANFVDDCFRSCMDTIGFCTVCICAIFGTTDVAVR